MTIRFLYWGGNCEYPHVNDLKKPFSSLGRGEDTIVFYLLKSMKTHCCGHAGEGLTFHRSQGLQADIFATTLCSFPCVFSASGYIPTPQWVQRKPEKMIMLTFLNILKRTVVCCNNNNTICTFVKGQFLYFWSQGLIIYTPYLFIESLFTLFKFVCLFVFH